MDAGDEITHIVPVTDGYVIRSAMKSSPITGRDLTLFVQQLMREKGENILPKDSLEVARRLKEVYCYADIVKEFVITPTPACCGGQVHPVIAN